MGLFDRFRRVNSGGYPLLPTTPEAYGDGGAWGYEALWRMDGEDHARILGMNPSEMWRTQPYLRTVVSFLARNIAQLGLHAFLRAGENDRERLRDGGVADVVRAPNRTTTTYELIYGLVADLALYDVAYWMLTDSPTDPVVRLPVSWVTPRGGDVLGPEWYQVRANDKGEHVRIEADKVLAFHGWDPSSLVTGSSPVQALKGILAEQVQAAKYREHVWARGGKVGAVLSRPPDAPRWSDDARKRFKEDWDSRFTGDGPGVGGTPLLEDGMSLSRVDFSAHDMQFVEGARLALNTVASVYHVNPTMIGLLDNANYSNVREFRRMLYGDTLGPTIAMIEDRLNRFLVPRYDTRSGVYLEFNIEEKLQGNFEEQTQAIQSAVGRPWMTANEARALRNMPALPEGDDLVTPLNVLTGGLASPNDTAPDPEDTPPTEASGPMATKAALYLLKARAEEKHADEVARVLEKFLERQGSAVLGKVGAGDGWWDGDRWDRELSEDLHAVSLQVTAALGKAEARSLGYSPDDYDVDRTVDFLQAVAQRYATTVNATTKAQLEAQLEAEDGDPAHVYEPEIRESRASGVAAQVSTFLAGFATVEAARHVAQAHDVEPTKTWVTGPNPRAEHAAMDGETVPLDEDFSNGMAWPGHGDADDAGCNCSVLIST